MPVNHVVQAQVVDLQSDVPIASDAFLVDTNAWAWTCYAKSTLGMPYHRRRQTSDYSGYLKRCSKVGASLHWCGLAVSEVIHFIERTEFEIWKGTGHQYENSKEFRHNYPAERKGVVQEVENAWQSIEALGSILPAPLAVDATTAGLALTEFKTTALDGYDLFFLQNARASNVTQIISDDGDFCAVPGITLFTSNRGVIAAASAQRKLLTR